MPKQLSPKTPNSFPFQIAHLSALLWPSNTHFAFLWDTPGSLWRSASQAFGDSDSLSPKIRKGMHDEKKLSAGWGIGPGNAVDCCRGGGRRQPKTCRTRFRNSKHVWQRWKRTWPDRRMTTRARETIWYWPKTRRPAGVSAGRHLRDTFRPEEHKWAQQDSNLRPTDYESAALTN
jgi:hypothetical protein